MTLHEVDAPAARPYGLVGLIVSVILILAVTLLVCILVLAALFALSLATFGWQQTLDRVVDLDSYGTDPIFLEKLAIVGSLLAYAALSGAVVAAAHVRGRTNWREIIAWRPWSPFKGSAWIWGLAVLLIIYSLGADAAISHFAPKFNAIVHMPPGRTWSILFVLLAAVMAPIGEELLFRGWLYTSLRATFGVTAALLVVSVLFALAHWEGTHLYALAVFPVGLGLAWIRERTGSIKASICVHGFYNGIASVMLFFAK